MEDQLLSAPAERSWEHGSCLKKCFNEKVMNKLINITEGQGRIKK